MRVVRLERFAECARAKTPASVKPWGHDTSIFLRLRHSERINGHAWVTFLPWRLRATRLERLLDDATTSSPSSVITEQLCRFSSFKSCS